MKLLLDTHALLWWCADDPRLSAAARAAIGQSEHEVLVSAASAWEIATKARLGKLAGVERLLSDFTALMAADHFTLLPMSHAHALLAGSFAQAHRDPFDRMLAAQRIGISNAPASPDDKAATQQDGISAAARSWQRWQDRGRGALRTATPASIWLLWPRFAASISGLTLVR